MKVIKMIRRFSLATGMTAAAVLVFLSLINVEPAKASRKTPAPVNVKESEWFVMPIPLEASGDNFIKFKVTNVSDILAHEFIVIKLKRGQTYDNLPISTDTASEFFGRVDEDALGLQIKGAIEEEDLPPGGSAALTLGLPKGDYALICNLPGHYMLGMRSPFTNKGPHHHKDKNHHNDDDDHHNR